MSQSAVLIRVVRIATLGVLLLAGLLLAANIAGARRWRGVTARLRAPLLGGPVTVVPSRVDFRELEELPPPVERYLRKAITVEGAMLVGARMTHAGTFNLSEGGERWSPFTSEQIVVTSLPGFDWDARIRILPGVAMRVHDAYVAGEGILHVSLLGFVDVAALRDSAEMARGELMRYLAETPWYPTALLPSQGVRWEGVDDSTAWATLAAGRDTVTLRFRFGADSLVSSVYAEARGRMEGDAIVPTQWEGRFWDYALRDGSRVPLQGEVAWLTAEGRKPYFRARLEEIQYAFAR